MNSQVPEVSALIDAFKRGQKRTLRTEVCSLATTRRVAAMLDQNPDELAEGSSLPRGWHFPLLAGDTRRSLLRADGFPGLGVVMPDFGLPRVLLGSRAITFSRDIPIGAALLRQSQIQKLTEKPSPNGPMVVVTIEHELRLQHEDLPALTETQTYLLVAATKGAQTFESGQVIEKIEADRVKTVVPDETLLFQYSALGFNSHKIHLDRAYAREVEGFPDLVVNGGLATLLLLKFFREEIGVLPTAMSARHLRPLFCSNPITMTANKVAAKWLLRAYDHRSVLAVEMEVEPFEL
jgi:3-methylfumaryl-CoA hydratase